MDRNSAIGMTLIVFLLMVYFYFFFPQSVPQTAKKVDTTSVIPADTSTHAALKNSTTQPDSAALQSYGHLGSLLNGTETFTTVTNNDIRIVMSNKGYISELELLKYKTYLQKPLYLMVNRNNSFSLKGLYQGKEIDLYQLFYQPSVHHKSDTTVVILSATIREGASISHIYSIPSTGYQVGYRMDVKGVIFDSQHLSLNWKNAIALQEKDISDSRKKTTIHYYSTDESFDGLSEAEFDTQETTFSSPIQWVSIRQKFFISAIIANRSFSGGEVAISGNPSDTSVVKNAQLRLFIPTEQISSKQAAFKYYFGPNDYELIGSVAPEFRKNLPLGWPPMSWINRFIIIPIFKFLQGFISNYGVIIILLVLLVKIILLPLSYSSYLGMAKMKLLKPEMDAIKAKNADNMAQSQQDTMKLYRQVGVNPFAGCIPLLLQMPILFALFTFFPVAIDLRQKSFLWAEDLSTFDSILNLPFSIPFYGSHVSLFVLLMTASTIIYQWQNNQMSTVEGPMKTMGYIMPIVFLFVLNSFPSGLSFYYFVSNLITFTQQAIIKRFVDEDKIMALMEENRKKAASGTGKKSKFMTKLEEAMKASEEARKVANAKKKKK